MWAIRILSGPQSGQIFPLKKGKNKIGRGATCDIQLSVNGVSKEHLEINMHGDKLVMTDLRSSNGTFLNGVRIQSAMARLGDKVRIDQLFFDVVMTQTEQAQALHPVSYQRPVLAPQIYMPQQPGAMPIPEPVSAPLSVSHGWQEKFDRYLHQVVLPALYRLVEVFEFRTVMMGFSAIFIFMVTLLSIFPMNQITSESIHKESRRRAQTVARALANSNEKAIRSGDISSYSADLVLRDEGISNVYILAKDGSVLAPPEMAGMTIGGERSGVKYLAGFVAQIRGQTKEFSAEVGEGRIAASTPILVFDPEFQQNVAKAHAVVVYDTGSLKFDDGRALSLFIQMLAIALIVGAAMFFLMYKLIEYPFLKLQSELDQSLREGRDHVDINIQFPVLEKVLVSVNSLLTRVQQGGSGGAVNSVQLRDQDWAQVTALCGYPAILISKEMSIVSMNGAFEALTGVQAFNLLGQSIYSLPDQAMQKNFEGLLQQAAAQTQVTQQDQLEISGHEFRLQCQAITVGGDAKYFFLTVSPIEQIEGGAA